MPTVVETSDSVDCNADDAPAGASEFAPSATGQTLVLSEVFPPQHGGSGKWLWEVYRRQPAGRYVMAVGDSHGSDPRDAEYPQAIARLDLAMRYRGVASLDSVRQYARQVFLLRRLVKRHGVTAIHASRPLSEGLLARSLHALTGIPYACYVHGEDVNIATTSRELKLLTNAVLRRCVQVFANSTFTKDLLIHDWSIAPARVTLMHPGVDTGYFSPAAAGDRRPGPWEGKTILLTVGRLQKRKGHDTVIRAVAELRREFPDLHYAVAGEGEERAALENLARQLGVTDSVEFLGPLGDDELRKRYQHCDIFVLANRTIGKDVEGFGIVLLEAQACGRPVIAGASGGTLDTLRQGETGFLADCDTPDHLIKLLREILPDRPKREAMGSSGREHVTNRFDWSALGAAAAEAFDSAFAPASPRGR